MPCRLSLLVYLSLSCNLYFSLAPKSRAKGLAGIALCGRMACENCSCCREERLELRFFCFFVSPTSRPLLHQPKWDIVSYGTALWVNLSQNKNKPTLFRIEMKSILRPFLILIFFYILKYTVNISFLFHVCHICLWKLLMSLLLTFISFK